MRLYQLLFLTALFFLNAYASLIWGDAQGGQDPRRQVVLLSYGEAMEPVTVIASGDVVPVVDTDSDLVEISEPVISDDGWGNRNYTYEFTFATDVGIVPYSISAEGYPVLQGTFVVAGFVLKDAGTIVSGDAVTNGASVGQEGRTMYQVSALGTDGGSVDLSGTNIVPRGATGDVYMMEVDQTYTRFAGSTFTLAINKLRVGSGAFSINFEASAITSGGETFETVLFVRQATSPEPPCVVMGSSLTADGAVVEANMYNLLSPPLSTPVKEISLSIAGRTIAFDSDRSSFVLPTSTVVFTSVSGEGPAEITCDGVPAVVVQDNDIVESLTVERKNGPESLAVDELVKPMPTSATDQVITSIIRVVDSDPSTLTTTVATVIMDEYCSTVSAIGACVPTNITEGSALIGTGAIVKDYVNSQSTVAARFSTCAFQAATGFECDKLQLLGSEPTNALAGVAAAGGIATWTIVLVSCIGALSLIALLVLTVWAMHRRAAMQSSESSYSSSGPMGVPDPSDMLYEQTIVRDIYGRGPDGGLTQEDADASERIAALREETPRPPSSGSGMSRRASEDASSTYSV